MWQFAEAVRGLADGCLSSGTPVTGGNVSFYNQTGTTPILPTPVIGVLGVIDDVTRRTRQGFPRDGAQMLPARRHPRRVRRLGVGARGARLPRRPAAGGRPRARAAARRRADRRRARRPARRRARPVRGRAGPGAGRGVPARRRRRARSSCPRAPTRSSRCSASRPAARSSACRVARMTGSSNCAPSAGLPCTRLGVVDTLDARLDVRFTGGAFDIPLRELRAAWASPLPTAFE